MDFIKNPSAIEDKSMDLIYPFISDIRLTEAEVAVYSRMIHASGDVDYGHLIQTSPGAAEVGVKALSQKCGIYSDVNMVKAGINQSALRTIGSTVECRISDPEIARIAKEKNIARSMAAMQSFGERLNGSIIAIGNAPTALYEVLRMIEEDNIRPALVIGIPVGFVGAADSKEELIRRNCVPFITVRGTKGGSSIVASVVNALMYQLVNRDNMLYIQGKKETK